MNLKKHTDKDLLKLYAQIMEELRLRKVVRSGNNPVADYAEKISAKYLGLKLENNSNLGFDAVKRGVKYQIKSRRITPRNKSRQLGVIRNLKKKHFDYLLAVIFDENFVLKELWKIPHAKIAKYSKYRAHQNGHILVLRGKILKDKSISNLVKN